MPLITGDASNNVLSGTVDNDTILGFGGDDLIDGSLIGDSIDGGADNDTVSYGGLVGPVTVTLEFVEGTDRGGDSFGNVLVGIENLIGTAQGDELTGSSLANRLEGGGGDDVLSGAGGNDTLVGGAGSNLLDGGEGSDTADYGDQAGPITANLVDGTVSHGGELDTLLSIERVVATAALTDTLDYSTAGTGVSVSLEIVPGSGVGEDSLGHQVVGFETVIGSAQGDELTGSSLANRLEGGGGDDVLSGAGGNDTLVGGAGSNLLDGGEGSDTADYGDQAGPITANLVDGTVSHGGGLDTLLSIERVVATAAPTDTLDYSTAGTGVSVSLEIVPGSGVGEDSLGHQVVGFETVIGSAQGDELTGSSLANRLEGGGGDDVLSGAGGNDTLVGGAGSNLLDGGEGSDTADYGDQAGPITANLVDGTVSHGGGLDTLLSIERVVATAAPTDTLDYSTAGTGVSVSLEIVPGSGVGEDSLGHQVVGFETVIGSAQGDELTGSSLANRLEGGGGDDVLSGAGGNDTLVGGAGSNLLDGGEGSDTADYGDQAGPITANLVDGTVSHGGGLDTLLSIERVVATAAPTDTLDYSTAGTGVSVSLEIVPGSGVGEDSLGHQVVGFETVIGTAQGDELTGSSLANRLEGGGGDDVLSGAGGNDTLVGGAGSNLLDGGEGSDTADYGDQAGPITANLVDGTVSHGGGLDTLLSIERVVATAALTDTLDYSTAGTGVSVSLEIVPGSGVGEDSLGHQVVGFETVIGSAQGDELTGSSLANRLEGGGGDDVLSGAGGNDTLVGGAGSNLLDGGEGSDTADYGDQAGPITANLVDGTVSHGGGLDTLLSIERVVATAAPTDTLDYSTAGTGVSVSLEIVPGSGVGEDSLGHQVVGFETVIGSAQGDELTGSSLANRLEGGGGDDVLSGAGGNDTLVGGAGSNLLDGGEGSDTADYGDQAGPITANLVDGTVSHGGELDTLLSIERVVATAAPTDTLDYSTAGTGVSVSLEIVPGSGVGEDSLGHQVVGFETVIGSAQGDELTGSSLANRLEGGGGDDVLSGAGGNDTLVGGAGSNLLDGGEGSDTADYGDQAGPITANLVDGTVSHGGELDTLLSIERVVATAALTDTLDYSTAGTGVSVSLEIVPGSGVGEDSLGHQVVGFETVIGSAQGDELTGSSLANRLEGGGGDDVLSGAGGNDTLVGGAGSNLLDGGEGSDTADYGDQAGPITANLVDGTVSHGGELDTLLSIERVVATAAPTDTLDYSTAGTGVSVSLEIVPGSGVGEDSLGHQVVGFETVIGSAQGDELTGSSLANRLEGGGGDDVLSGAGGNDTLVGGAGSNLLDGGEGSDTADYGDQAGPITANLVDGTVSHGGELDTLLSIERVVATAAPTDTLDYSTAGTGVSVSLEIVPGSGVGEDSLGHQVVGFETVIGSAQGDELTGSSLANRLEGGGGDDVLSGAGGNDTLVGGAGSNLLDGGEGSDTADYSDQAGPITANLVDGTVSHGGELDTLLSIERVVATAAPTDTLDYSTAGTGVSVSLEIVPGSGVGEDSLGHQVVGFETVIGSAQGDELTGSSLANRLEGGGGDDVLSGAGGNDTLVGGAGSNLLDGGEGSDTADYGDQAGPITANLVDGTVSHGGELDTLLSIERVVATAAPTDTLDYSTAGTGVSVSLEIVPGSGVGEDSLGHQIVGFETVIGSAQGDELTGSSLANRLEGGGGDDVLSGAGGNDTLVGGAGSNLLDGGEGSDTADYSDQAGPITANLVDGTVSHGGELDTLLSIERVVATAAPTDTLDYSTAGTGVSVSLEIVPGSGVGEDSLGHQVVGFETVIGSAQGDELTGSSLANRLEGGGGDDVLSGAGGNDTLVGGAGSNLLDGGEGSDTADYGDQAGPITANLVDGTVSHGGELDTLLSIERVVATAAPTDTLDYSTAGTGVSVSLEIVPGSGVGEDSLGHQVVGFETVIGSAQGDELTGSSLANRLEGGGGDDVLSGAGGNDTLVGGAGSNLLDGGEGSDTADYSDQAGPITANLVDGTVSHGGELDTLLSIERVVATAALTDTLDYSTAGTGVSVSLEIVPGSGVGEDSLGHQVVGFETVIGSAQGDELTGSSLANRLEGGGGDDVLSGAGGNDTLVGGAGSNLLDGGEGSDTADYGDQAGPVIAMLTLGTAVHAGGVDTLISIENLTGSSYNDFLGGDAGPNRLEGGAGNDTLASGEGGPDTLIGGDGFDIADFSAHTTGIAVDLTTGLSSDGGMLEGIEGLIGGSADDTLTGNAEIGTWIYGGAGEDVLTGGSGDDTLIGGAGDDLLSGGEGFDEVNYSFAQGPVDVDLAAQTAIGDGTDTLVDIEAVIGTTGNDTLHGAAGANFLFGSDGNDLLKGDLDGDTLHGGNGNDTVSYAGASAAVLIDMAAGYAASLAAGTVPDTLISIENAEGSAFNDYIVGTSGANSLAGGEGNDTLDGRGGLDTLDGGNGYDIADFRAVEGSISVHLAAFGQGDGLEGSSGARLLSIEGVVGTNSGDNITGDDGANFLYGLGGDDVLTGGAGSDTLIGGEGDDLLDGGEGDDLVDYRDATGGVVIDLAQGFATGGGIGTDILIGIEWVVGSIYNDSITGDDGNNFLFGNDGDDTIAGGLGDDTIVGGAGTNTVTYAAAAQGVIVNLVTRGAIGEGTDSLIDIQNVIGSSHADHLIGDAGANRLEGGAGDDTILGGGGADTLIGGDGFDIVSFMGHGSGVVASLTLGTASTGATLSGFEGMFGSSFGDFLTGDAQDNYIDGGAGDDSLAGLDGNDTLLGGAGNNILDGGVGDDIADFRFLSDSVRVTLNDAGSSFAGHGIYTDELISIEHLVGSQFGDEMTGNELSNFIYGFGGDDMLSGAGGSDTLVGGDGADTLIGGTGDDVLTGGAGADRFRFEAGDGTDFITDFETGIDKIELLAASYGGATPLVSVVAGNYVISIGAETIIIGNSQAFDLLNDLVYV